jgi:hypothetical protein
MDSATQSPSLANLGARMRQDRAARLQAAEAALVRLHALLRAGASVEDLRCQRYEANMAISRWLEVR